MRSVWGLLGLAIAVIAVPIELESRNNGSSDSGSSDSLTTMDVLQYALTLEILENTLYKKGFNQYDQSAFQAAGYSDWAYLRFSEIINEENHHIAFLQAAIRKAGGTPVQACQYSFNYTDVTSFLKLAQMVDGLGPNAYIGGGAFLSGETLTNAASILTIESRHNTWLRSTLLKDDPFPTAFEQPLTPMQAYSVAAPFIKPGSCPSDNYKLPLKAYPALMVKNMDEAPFSPGATLQIATPAKLPSTVYAVFLGNSKQTVLSYDKSGSITIPDNANVKGQTYLALTSSKNLDDSTILAGPTPVDVALPATLFSLQSNTRIRF